MTIDFKKLLFTDPPLWVVVGVFVLMALTIFLAMSYTPESTMIKWVIFGLLIWCGVTATNHTTMPAPKNQDIRVTFVNRKDTQVFNFTGNDYYGYVIENKAESYNQQLPTKFKCRDLQHGIELCFSALRFLSKTLALENHNSYHFDDVWMITNIKKLIIENNDHHWENILPEYYFYTAESFSPEQTIKDRSRALVTPCVLMVDDTVWDSVASTFGAIRNCEPFGERCQLDFLQLSLHSPDLPDQFAKLCAALHANETPTASITAIFYDPSSHNTISLVLNENYHNNDPRIFNPENCSAWPDQLQLLRNITN